MVFFLAKVEVGLISGILAKYACIVLMKIILSWLNWELDACTEFLLSRCFVDKNDVSLTEIDFEFMQRIRVGQHCSILCKCSLDCSCGYMMHDVISVCIRPTIFMLLKLNSFSKTK